MTRSSLAILVVQTALLVFLAVRVISIEQQVDELASDTNEQSQSTTSSTAITVPAKQQEYAGTHLADVREVIRAELAALESRVLDSLTAHDTAPVEERPVDPTETEYLKSTIDAELQSLIANGPASPMEMASLQAKIGRLPAGEREAALRRVFKAINDGYLDARF